MKLNITAPGGVASVVDGAIEYPFVGAYPAGANFDGTRYVVAPNGIKMTEPTPLSLTDTGRFKNGYQLNPQRVAGGINNSLDSGVGSTYSATLQPNLSTTVMRPGDVLVKAQSTPELVNSGREGPFTKVSALFVVDTPPPFQAMAPIVWPSADTANRPWRVADLDGFLALQPNLSTAGQTIVPWSVAKAYFDKLSIGAYVTTNDGPGGYEYLSTFGLSDGPNSNYGRYTSRVVAAVLCGLMSAGWSSADKTEAAIRLLQMGCNFAEAAVAFNIGIATNGGGHTHGHYGACAAWLRATGRQALYPAQQTLLTGNIKYQYYRYDAGMLANDFVYHTDPLKPYYSRGRQVLSVAPDFLSCTVERFVEGQSLLQDTHYNGVLHGLNLRRNSDNAQVYCSNSVQVGDGVALGAYFALTLATPFTGLAVGQMVNMVQPWTMAVGDPDFQLVPAVNVRNPSHLAEYRWLNNFNAIHHLYVHAIGMHTAEMNISRDYTLRAMEAANPTVDQNYTSHADTTAMSVGNNWATEFWNAHSATILAMPQIV